ncbi:DUF1592 domain-containing protein [Planctomicrobium sp. SH664]|uniref:DUF1592 domain-containing protein n=1 Tax=Planctomicrobium sp. SH664 TaxID=3448125 RepID=UPI003F5BB13E
MSLTSGLLVLLPFVLTMAARGNDLAATGAPLGLSPANIEFVQSHCVGCHSGKSADAGLALDFVEPGANLREHGEALERAMNMVSRGEMPPVSEEQPSLDDREMFVTGIEELLDRIDQATPPDPGRVTMRRLNRMEYTNTVRDLLGIDFNPAQHFPADEIANGFDNNGDTLKISPVLMERYLIAAEKIAQGLLPASKNQRRVDADELEFQPVTDILLKQGYYEINNSKADLKGAFWLEEKLAPGNYVISTRAYAQAPPETKTTLAVVAVGEKLKGKLAPANVRQQLPGLQGEPCCVIEMVEITSRDSATPAEVKVNLPPMEGIERIGLVLVDEEKSPPVVVHVSGISIDGPFDKAASPWQSKIIAPPGLSQSQHNRKLIRELLPRAYRRAVSDEEVERLCALADWAAESHASVDEQWRLMLEAILVSPKFLFRVELDANPTSREVHPIDDVQLASRLSYFLWKTMPDDELRNLAIAGQLTENLDAQVMRMLKDPRGKTLTDDFTEQWLQLKLLEGFAPNQRQFPDFSRKTKALLLTETQMFMRTLLLENRNVTEILGTNFTFLNEPLAKHYGIEDTHGNRADMPPIDEPGDPIKGNSFRRVTFPNANMGGVLRHASVLSITSQPTRTSPVKRGHWVLEQLLDSSPPPAPPNVPNLNERRASNARNLRQVLELHRSDPACAGCHARMDPIGFALEYYDPVGRPRIGQDLDLSGELPGGQKFNGPDELIEILRGRRDQFVHCLSEKLLTYALGRGLERSDRPALHRIVKNMKQHDDGFMTLVLEIVHSEPFRMRRGEAL